MNGVLTAAEWMVAGVALVVCALLVLLFVRRRWLSRQGGMFDCSVRLVTSTPGTGWVLGVARYQGAKLEWFRSFTLSFRPRLVFVRGEVQAGAQRPPSEVESVLLYENQRVIELTTSERTWELAMASGSLTGLLSWLEAAPPGASYRDPL